MTESARARRGLRWAAGFALLGLVAGCSGGGDAAPSPGSSTSSATPTATKVARIGVISSATGVLAPTGKGVRDSVELAVRDANVAELVPGWSFDAVPANDSSGQSGGQQAASGLAADARVIGVVGSTRSTIDEGMQPILNSAGVPLVSPAGTAATLTRRLDGGTIVRPFPTYFRLSATDADQGTAGARYAKNSLKATRVAVLTDGTSYGRLLTATFTAEAKRLKLARPVERTVAVAPDTAEAVATARLEKAAQAVRRGDVDLVFFGGTSDAAAAFAQALKVERVEVPLMGGDALLDGRFLTDHGAIAAEGDLAVFPGAPPEELATARNYVRRFRAAGFGPDPGPYGANAYDATRAIIEAFGRSVGDATAISKSVRAGVVEELGTTRFEGATGPVSFDRFGDAVVRPLAVYEVVGRGWEVAGTVRVG